MQIKIPIELPDNFFDIVAENLIKKGDVVLVTRCKDCKYYHQNYKQFESDKPYNRCEHPAQQFDIECYDMWLETNPDDFCSYAEPKEIEDNNKSKDLEERLKDTTQDMTIDEKIEYWHNHNTGNSLREFLGMTEEEYLNFALGKTTEEDKH